MGVFLPVGVLLLARLDAVFRRPVAFFLLLLKKKLRVIFCVGCLFVPPSVVVFFCWVFLLLYLVFLLFRWRGFFMLSFSVVVKYLWSLFFLEHSLDFCKVVHACGLSRLTDQRAAQSQQSSLFDYFQDDFLDSHGGPYVRPLLCVVA